MNSKTNKETHVPYYRTCYKNGIVKAGNEVYELTTLCKCDKCISRHKLTRTSRNEATASTEDIDKIAEVFYFLNDWTCSDGEKELETAYFEM